MLKQSTFIIAILATMSGLTQQGLSEGLGGMVNATAVHQGSISSDDEEALRREIFGKVLDRAFPAMSRVWSRSTIPVCWENAAPNNSDDRALVRQAVARTWEANSALNFTGWSTCRSNNRGIRILISDEGPHTKGLGKQLDGIKNGMLLNFTFVNWSPVCANSEGERLSCIYTIAVHEFGHALGFAHEQNRLDTPESHCFERKQGSDGDTFLTPWDPESVMNYCNPKYNNNGMAVSILKCNRLV